jgi:hypothetical protein
MEKRLALTGIQVSPYPLLLVLSMALANLCHLYVMVGIGIEGVGSEMWDE